jgi:hypothetical protein
MLQVSRTCTEVPGSWQQSREGYLYFASVFCCRAAPAWCAAHSLLCELHCVTLCWWVWVLFNLPRVCHPKRLLLVAGCLCCG